MTEFQQIWCYYPHAKSMLGGSVMKNKLTDMEKRIIEKRAVAVLKAFGYQDEKDTRIDSVKLARFFGFTVEEEELLQHEDGNINVRIPTEGENCPEEKYIVVNRNRSRVQKRFIITHELSHYLLHYTGEPLFMHREDKKGKSLEENDADYMAACLLMPARSFKAQYHSLMEYRSHEELIVELGEIFHTSRESVIRRINEVCPR